MCGMHYQRVLRHDPTDPSWVGRDRFVLSAGHSSLTQYIQLYLGGFGLELVGFDVRIGLWHQGRQHQGLARRLEDQVEVAQRGLTCETGRSRWCLTRSRSRAAPRRGSGAGW